MVFNERATEACAAAWIWGPARTSACSRTYLREYTFCFAPVAELSRSAIAGFDQECSFSCMDRSRAVAGKWQWENEWRLRLEVKKLPRLSIRLKSSVAQTPDSRLGVSTHPNSRPCSVRIWALLSIWSSALVGRRGRHCYLVSLGANYWQRHSCRSIRPCIGRRGYLSECIGNLHLAMVLKIAMHDSQTA